MTGVYSPDEKLTPRRSSSLLWRGAAALVHVFTALGVACALLALLAVLDGRYTAAFGWLGVALIIDGVDGTFARYVDVSRRVPRISGETLDLVVDYTTYVFVPIVALLKAGFLVGAWGLALAVLALMSSLFHFSDKANKADDYSFVGFPAVWNIVAFYLFAFAADQTVTALVVIVCVVLTFIPMRWVHPMRVARLKALNIGVSVLGAIASIWVLWRGFPADVIAKAALACSGLYGVGLAFVRPWAPVHDGST